MGGNEPWVVVVVAIFGAGGLVSLVKAVLDHLNGKASKESEVEVRYLLNREKRITQLEKRTDHLEKDRDARAHYEAILIGELARNGLPIPPRPRSH